VRREYQRRKRLKLSFLAALRFLTIIRFPLRREVTPEELARSQVFFPVVGFIIGLILAGLNWLFGLALPPLVANVLLIASLAGITGALHLDGFADTCDGIGGQKTIEERWKVMRDSRVGGFGVIGVSLLLLVKFISLNNVPPSMMTITLIIMPVISRWAMVYALFTYPYARPEGLGTVFKQQASPQKFSVATIITLAVVMLLTLLPNIAYSYLAALVIMGGTWVIVTAAATYLKHKFAGLTGDNYGAINEIAEVSVLILVSMLAHNRWLGIA